MLRAYLPPNAILVGQNIQCDVQWLQLAEGVDYHSFIGMSLNDNLLPSIRSLYRDESIQSIHQIYLSVVVLVIMIVSMMQTCHRYFECGMSIKAHT